MIDAEDLLKIRNNDTMSDTIHLNEKGSGILAQEIYMRLAFARNLKSRINLIYESSIDLEKWREYVAYQNEQRSIAA